jgi:hypothetical protein
MQNGFLLFESGWFTKFNILSFIKNISLGVAKSKPTCVLLAHIVVVGNGRCTSFTMWRTWYQSWKVSFRDRRKHQTVIILTKVYRPLSFGFLSLFHPIFDFIYFDLFLFFFDFDIWFILFNFFSGRWNLFFLLFLSVRDIKDKLTTIIMIFIYQY